VSNIVFLPLPSVTDEWECCCENNWIFLKRLIITIKFSIIHFHDELFRPSASSGFKNGFFFFFAEGLHYSPSNYTGTAYAKEKKSSDVP